VLTSYRLLAVASGQIKELNYYNTAGAGIAQWVQRLDHVLPRIIQLPHTSSWFGASLIKPRDKRVKM
jgi:hypothetical protein